MEVISETVVLWMFYAILILLGLSFIVALKGPSIWDRVLSMNIIATKVVAIILIHASIRDTAFFLDFALIYALSGFIGTIYIALFFADRKKRSDNK